MSDANEKDDVCVYCGSTEALTDDHIPRFDVSWSEIVVKEDDTWPGEKIQTRKSTCRYRCQNRTAVIRDFPVESDLYWTVEVEGYRPVAGDLRAFHVTVESGNDSLRLAELSLKRLPD